MSRLKGLLGLFAFIFICLGLVFYVFFPVVQWLTMGTWAIACALTAIWVVVEHKSILQFLTRKSTRYGANLFFIVAMMVGILVFLNVLSRDYHWRKDISFKGTNTLSEQSKKILNELSQKVNIIYLAKDMQRTQAEDLFKRYTYVSKNISYEMLDPNRYPSRVRALGIDKVENDLLILQLAEGNKKITVQGVTEEKLTNGLVKLLKTKSQTIIFSAGHGERLVDATVGSQDSATLFKSELEKEAYATKTINLFTEGKIPAEASAFVILGPKTAFFPKEIEILKAWIDNGGRLLVALDVDFRSGNLSIGSQQIAKLLKDYGITVGTQLLVDPASRAANVEPQILMANAGSKEHLITKDFPTSSVGLVANFLFPLTARLTKAEQVPQDVTITELARTTPNAWEESDWTSVQSGRVNFDQGKDFRGEMDLGYAYEKKDGPRLVVYGSSAIAIDNIFNFSGNKDLLMNSVSWLADNTEFISIRPKDESESDKLKIDANLLGLIRLVVIFILPVSILVTGIWVWHRRRGR